MAGRFWIEMLRVDTATEILGIRVNLWLSIVAVGGAVVAIVVRGLWRTARGVSHLDRLADGLDPELPWDFRSVAGPPLARR